MLKKIADSFIHYSRVLWRPLAAIAIISALLVNGTIIPYLNKEVVDLEGLATVIAAVATAFAVREWGKIKGGSDDD